MNSELRAYHHVATEYLFRKSVDVTLLSVYRPCPHSKRSYYTSSPLVIVIVVVFVFCVIQLRLPLRSILCTGVMGGLFIDSSSAQY